MNAFKCPGCGTRYDIPDALQQRANGLASCHRCGSGFSLDDGSAVDLDARDPATLARVLRLRNDMEIATDAHPAAVPFDVPDNLPPLQADPDAALDADALLKTGSRRGIWLSGLVALTLAVGLGLQLAWQYRDTLFARYPQLTAVCQHVKCQPDTVHEPELFRVLQRAVRASDNQPGSLTLSVTFRNDAKIGQHYPDLHLSLLDNNGGVLIRRRLAPANYLFPTPADAAVIEPGEVVTFSLDFEDPGYQATGFVIDFL
ncbi:MAG: DUF3426 domain-containing protein [Gammaproteobacteria bacterium]|nr:DUF3426 domain-containing protein [Gammaproteobacteria bacterium]